MTTGRRAADVLKVVPPAKAPRDPKVAAIREHGKSMDGVADAMNRIAAAMEAATVQRKPVDEFFQTANHTLTNARDFLNKRGPWLLGLSPLVLVMIGAISPNAAVALSEALRAIGAQ